MIAEETSVAVLLRRVLPLWRAAIVMGLMNFHHAASGGVPGRLRDRAKTLIAGMPSLSGLGAHIDA